VVLQQECEEGIFPHLPAIWRQHSRSSSVRVLSGSKHAIDGAPNNESANSTTANLPTDFTSDSVRVARLPPQLCFLVPLAIDEGKTADKLSAAQSLAEE